MNEKVLFEQERQTSYRFIKVKYGGFETYLVIIMNFNFLDLIFVTEMNALVAK